MRTKVRLISILINISIFAHMYQILFYRDIIYSAGMVILAIGWAIMNFVNIINSKDGINT
jgi:hypothetical protein